MHLNQAGQGSAYPGTISILWFPLDAMMCKGRRCVYASFARKKLADRYMSECIVVVAQQGVENQ
jgi:hypothetical protein